MNLPSLIFKKDYDILKKGILQTTCVCCGENTDAGFTFSFSDNFVGFNRFYYGEGICPICFAFFQDQKYRRSSFIATKESVEFIKNIDFLEKLKTLPEPPFFIYITHTFQKQGWIGDLNKISYSKENFYISTDFFENAIKVNYNEIIKRIEIVKNLLEKKISKAEITTTEFNSKTYQKAKNENFLDLLKEVKKYKREPLWEVVCYVSRRDK